MYVPITFRLRRDGEVALICHQGSDDIRSVDPNDWTSLFNIGCSGLPPCRVHDEEELQRVGEMAMQA